WMIPSSLTPVGGGRHASRLPRRPFGFDNTAALHELVYLSDQPRTSRLLLRAGMTRHDVYPPRLIMQGRAKLMRREPHSRIHPDRGVLPGGAPQAAEADSS